ncbi:MAG: hypothetical protein ACR2M4_11380 [Actinomycetota bacterium]
MSLAVTVGGIGLTYSHPFSADAGFIRGQNDPAKGIMSTWASSEGCSSTGSTLDSGALYTYEPNDPGVATNQYLWARKVRGVDVNDSAVPCPFVVC